MVKSVVKPLEMGFLRERIVPKKSVFVRRFSQCLQGLFGVHYLARSALLPAGASPPVSCSQSRRATICATSRSNRFLYQNIIPITRLFVKSFSQSYCSFSQKLSAFFKKSASKSLRYSFLCFYSRIIKKILQI